MALFAEREAQAAWNKIQEKEAEAREQEALAREQEAKAREQEAKAPESADVQEQAYVRDSLDEELDVLDEGMVLESEMVLEGGSPTGGNIFLKLFDF